MLLFGLLYDVCDEILLSIKKIAKSGNVNDIQFPDYSKTLVHYDF